MGTGSIQDLNHGSSQEWRRFHPLHQIAPRSQLWASDEDSGHPAVDAVEVGQASLYSYRGSPQSNQCGSGELSSGELTLSSTDSPTECLVPTWLHYWGLRLQWKVEEEGVVGGRRSPQVNLGELCLVPTCVLSLCFPAARRQVAPSSTHPRLRQWYQGL